VAQKLRRPRLAHASTVVEAHHQVARRTRV